MKLDKSSFVPLYRQLVTVFYRRILEGTYPLHSLVPAQKEIANEFDISLMVVRQAWQEMINDKIIISHRGHGSIVNKLPDGRKLNHSIHGLTYDSGKKATHKLIEFKTSQNDSLICNHFLESNCKGYTYLKRLRFVDDVAVSIEKNYLNSNVIEQFDVDRYNKSLSLYSYLTENYNISILYANEKIQAINADKDIAKTLSVSVGTPLLSVVRKTFCQEGMFEYTEYIIKSEYFGEVRYDNIRSGF
ncbi:GntR family transcriptional regulator [Salmonella enterica]|nr:GntR family transcriptional regulator [Salmonella enterica]ELV0714622.1 GntR family transcriptional regulator [Salmonella enterica]